MAARRDSTIPGNKRLNATKIQPILKEHCVKCHSTEKQKGDLDLEVFTRLDEIKRHPKVWQLVAEQLANKEMPPKKEPATLVSFARPESYSARAE